MDPEIYYALMVAITLSQLLVLLSINTWQVRQQKASMYVASYAHFSRMFLEIMSSLPGNPQPAEDEKKRWWYRYWDMFTGEVHLHMNGMLDKTIFEVWAQELARNFKNAPQGAEGMGTYEASHEVYMNRLKGPQDVEEFYRQFVECTSDTDDTSRERKIRELVEETHRLRKPLPLGWVVARIKKYFRKPDAAGTPA